MEMAFEPKRSMTQGVILEDALRFFRGFHDETPQDAEGRRELALAFESSGWVLHLLGRHAEAELDYDRALDQLRLLRTESYDTAAYLEDLAGLHERRGQLYIDMKLPDRARDSLREGLRYADTIATLRPGERAPRHRQARSHMALGRLYEREGRDPAFFESY